MTFYTSRFTFHVSRITHMKFSRDIFLVAVLFVVLSVIMFFVLPHVSPDTSPDAPYSTYSDYPEGAKVLYDLLKEFGFRVERIRAEPYVLPDNLAVLFLLQPHDTLEDQTRDEIRAFVERGGVLIVAGTDNLDELLLDYGVELVNAQVPLNTSFRLSSEPLFQYAPVNRFISQTDYAIHPVQRDVATLFGNGEDYSIVTSRVEGGRVFVLSCPYIFTRTGLGHAENAKLVYNLLTYLPRKSRIGFDEYHHGFRVYTESGESNGLIRLFLRTPLGLGFVCTGLLIFIFLILRGARFGQPVEIDASDKRLSSEYIFAMADLYQKNGQQSAILRHIRDEFRRSLASGWNINPTLDIPAFVDEIAKRKPIDADELQTLLGELEQTTSLSEARLLTLAQRVEAYQNVMRNV